MENFIFCAVIYLWVEWHLDDAPTQATQALQKLCKITITVRRSYCCLLILKRHPWTFISASSETFYTIIWPMNYFRYPSCQKNSLNGGLLWLTALTFQGFSLHFNRNVFIDHQINSRWMNLSLKLTTWCASGTTAY